MAIKHNSILPYYECGNLAIFLWPDKENLSFKQNTVLSIAKELKNAKKGPVIEDVYRKPIDLAKTLPKLESKSLEKVLGLANVLSADELASLEKEKKGIIRYLKNCYEGRLDDS